MQPADNPDSNNYNKYTAYALSAAQFGLGALLSWKTSYRSTGSMLMGAGCRSVYYAFKENNDKIEPTKYFRHSAAGAIGSFFSSLSIIPLTGQVAGKGTEIFLGILGSIASKSVEEGKLPQGGQIVKQALNGAVGPAMGVVSSPFSSKLLNYINLNEHFKEFIKSLMNSGVSSGASKVSDNWLSGKELGEDLFATIALCGLISGSLKGLKSFQAQHVQTLIDHFEYNFKGLKEKQDWLEKNLGSGMKRAVMEFLDVDASAPKLVNKYLVEEGMTPENAEKAIQVF